ncbi:MAG: NAD-dependent epimerase/dehydratase family protein [Calothrix sp. MO_192.B10]|nr:NAD-dependent epimerase/dehydratase family protein [Calothrix sp. MO_192.B10]
MKILVIGGTNFIGPHVIRYLASSGHQIAAFHRGKTDANLPNQVEHILGDRHHLHQYQPQIQQFAPDVVLDMIPYILSDAQMVIETIHSICDRVVAISSQDVYRARDIIWGIETNLLDSTPLKEDSPLRSHYYPYKDGAPLGLPPDYEKILVEQTYLNAPNLQATILRLPMVYGANDPLHRFAAYLQRMDRGRKAIILEENLAHWRSSYGYVENVAWGIALAVEHQIKRDSLSDSFLNRIFNISEATPFTEMERLELLGKLAGWKGEVIAVNKDYLPESWQLPFNMQQDWVTDSNRIRQELGYQEPIDRSEAMKRTLEWERLYPPVDISQSASAIALLEETVEDAILKSM